MYFGVPLSNFAGWLFVGAVGVGGYLLMERLLRPSLAAGDRPGLGIGLYYGVLGFNFAMTAWIGEWSLLLAGLALHIVLGIVLSRLSRTGTWSSLVRPDALGDRRGSPSEA
jgi:putative membrane protein